MAKPGTPSGENHSADNQACGRKRKSRSANSVYRCLMRWASAVPAMRIGRSHRRMSSNCSSLTRRQEKPAILVFKSAQLIGRASKAIIAGGGGHIHTLRLHRAPEHVHEPPKHLYKSPAHPHGAPFTLRKETFTLHRPSASLRKEVALKRQPLYIARFQNETSLRLYANKTTWRRDCASVATI